MNDNIFAILAIPTVIMLVIGGLGIMKSNDSRDARKAGDAQARAELGEDCAEKRHLYDPEFLNGGRWWLRLKGHA